MSSTLALIAVAVLIVANGLFVAFEFALVSSRPGALQDLAARGDRRAVAAVRQLGQLSFVLSAAQFGITATSLVVGFLAEDAIGDTIVDPVLGVFGLSDATRTAVTVGIAFALSTVVQMLLGELFPKNLALARPEATTLRLARLMRGFGVAFGPVIRLFDASAAWTTRRVFRVEVVAERHGGLAPDELARIIDASRTGGELSDSQGQLLARAVALGDRRVNEVMVSRTRVHFLDADDTLEDLRSAARATGHSRFPVRGEDDDDVVGSVHIKDVLAVAAADRPATRLGAIAQPVLAVPESDRLRRVLGRMRASQRTFALVVDEYGGTAGIVSVEDVLEELVGAIEDEFDAAPGPIRMIGQDRWLVDGTLRLDEVAEAVGIDLPLGDYETIAGFLIDRLGRIPASGAAVLHGDVELVAHHVDGVRVATVLLRPSASASDPAADAGGAP